MISCGEPSGDLYAGALASEILRLEPDVVITGFGSDRLRAAGATLVGDFKGLSVTGLTEALRVFRRSWQNYRALVRAGEGRAARRLRPDRLSGLQSVPARALHKRGVPIVYYISPQLWAWRRGRLKTMKRVADRVLVIFPFEAPFYEAAGVPVTFVGHPLLELTPPPEAREPFLREHGLDPDAPRRRAAAGQPAQRAARDPAGSGAHGRRHRAPPAVRAVPHRPGAASRRRAAGAARGLAGRRVAAGRRRGADRRRPGERRRRRPRVGDRDGAGGAARVPDGHRLSRRRRSPTGSASRCCTWTRMRWSISSPGRASSPS